MEVTKQEQLIVGNQKVIFVLKKQKKQMKIKMKINIYIVDNQIKKDHILIMIYAIYIMNMEI